MVGEGPLLAEMDAGVLGSSDISSQTRASRESCLSKQSRPSCWTQSPRQLAFGVVTANFILQFCCARDPYPESSAQSTLTESTHIYSFDAVSRAVSLLALKLRYLRGSLELGPMRVIGSSRPAAVSRSLLSLLLMEKVHSSLSILLF